VKIAYKIALAATGQQRFNADQIGLTGENLLHINFYGLLLTGRKLSNTRLPLAGEYLFPF